MKTILDAVVKTLNPAHATLLRDLPVSACVPGFTVPSADDAEGVTRLMWAFFLSLSQVPRASGDMDAVRQWVLDMAEMIPRCEAVTDGAGNVAVRSPGWSKEGGGDVEYMCVQGHMDMVASANRGSEHDFAKQGIPVGWKERKDGENWLHSLAGTTLGADNGVGVAAGLAAAAWRATADVPVSTKGVECLFTVDEETDMSGAENLAPFPFLRSKIMINADSEEERSICIGCAGGFETKLDLPVVTESNCDGFETISVAIRGLVGGHSGCDIHRARASAIVASARIADRVFSKVESSRLSAFKAGMAVNTIPREAEFSIVAGAGDDAARVVEAINAEWAVLRAEFNTVETEETDAMSIEIGTAPCCGNDGDSKNAGSLDATSSRRAMSLISLLPHGVLRMSPSDASAVETSSNLAIVELDLSANLLRTHLFVRSSRESQMAEARRKLEAIASLSGANISEMFAAFPGWQPNPASALLKTVVSSHEETLGSKPEIYSVHAGLECGLIKGPYPDLDVVSIGPAIINAHTPDESLLAESMPRFVSLLLAIFRKV